MIDLKVLKLERNYLTNCESKFKGTSNQDVPFFFFGLFYFSIRILHSFRTGALSRYFLSTKWQEVNPKFSFNWNFGYFCL